MKKLLFVLMMAAISIPVLQSCREETVEVDALEPDVEDSNDDEGFDTNPASDDQ